MASETRCDDTAPMRTSMLTAWLCAAGVLLGLALLAGDGHLDATAAYVALWYGWLFTAPSLAMWTLFEALAGPRGGPRHARLTKLGAGVALLAVWLWIGSMWLRAIGSLFAGLGS